MARSTKAWIGWGIPALLVIGLCALLPCQLAAIRNVSCDRVSIVLASMLLSAIGSLAALFLTVLIRGPETLTGFEGLGFRVYGSTALVLMWIVGSAAFTAMFALTAGSGY